MCVCVAEAHTNREEQGCVRVDSCSWKKGSAHNVVDVDPDQKVDSWSDVPHSGQAWFQVFTFSILPPLYPTPYYHLSTQLYTATSYSSPRTSPHPHCNTQAHTPAHGPTPHTRCNTHIHTRTRAHTPTNPRRTDIFLFCSNVGAGFKSVTEALASRR